jgi:hypothetical protein
MKNSVKLFGIIVFMTIIGLTFTSCGKEEGGTLEIRNLTQVNNLPVIVKSGSTFLSTTGDNTLDSYESKIYVIKKDSTISITAVHNNLFFPVSFNKTVTVSKGEYVIVRIE